MKAEKIKELIDDLFCDKFKVILIDGTWGVGKTYQVEQYLKGLPKGRWWKRTAKGARNKRFVYLSLFGKETIEDINKELFAKLHGLKNKAISVANAAGTVVSLIGATFNIKEVASLAVTLPTATIKKRIKKRKSKNVVVLFDDFERVSKELNYDALLGYFDELKRNGVKIGVICNSEKIDENRTKEYGKFKEKVFDREFRISEAEREVIQQIFGENARLFTERHYEIFNHNFRTVEKTKAFVDLCLIELKKAKADLSDETLADFIFYATAVIRVCNNDIKEKELSDKDDKNKNLKIMRDCRRESYGKFGDEIVAIESHYGAYFSTNDFVNALLYAYCELNYTSVIGFFVKAEGTVLDKHLLFLSDEEKLATVQAQYDMLLKADFKYEKTQQIIACWFDYLGKERLETVVDVDRLFEALVETIPDTRYESLGFDRVISFGHSKSYFEFRNKLLEAIDKKANDRFKKELETVPNNADSIQILERLSDVLLQAHKDTSEWEAFLLAQKFIFPSIGGVMTELTWHIAHKICDIVQKRIPNSADELKAVIREQIKASPNDFSLEYRGECLIHQYLGSQN